jgi:hypothetical protein
MIRAPLGIFERPPREGTGGKCVSASPGSASSLPGGQGPGPDRGLGCTRDSFDVAELLEQLCFVLQ